MKIETLRIKNFKVYRDVEILNLPPCCVFLGKNGSGKTTLFRIFAFLKECLANNVRTALNREGGRNGFQEVLSRGAKPHDAIEIEIQFRMEITGRERLVTYKLEIRLNDQGLPYISREVLRYKRGEYGSPFHFLDFRNGSGYAITNEEDFSKTDAELDREEQTLASADTLAIKGLGQFERFKAAQAFKNLIENWHISNFHINEARGVKDDEDARHLSASGDNLPSVARFLYEQHPETFETIKQKMRERVPGVEDIEVKLTEDGRLLMRYRDGSFTDPFIDKNVSDGTIKMFSYLILLHDPKPHPILCVEEPENQLYPELMTVLAEEFREYAKRGGQVFVSTHSPQFLNALDLNNLFIVEKRHGHSSIYPLAKDPLIREQMASGWNAGILWEQGHMQGVCERIEKSQG
jgi:predicted ATPase